MRLKGFSILLMMISFSSLASPKYEFSCKVVDAESGKPIPEAQMFIQEISQVSISDNNGIFDVKELKPGFYHVTVFAFQYEPLKQRIEIERNTTIVLKMNELLTELSEVVIMDDHENGFGLGRLQAVEGTAIYAGKKTEVIKIDHLNANLATNNARQVYAQVAGLNIYDSNDGGLQLNIGGRGLDPNRSSNFNTRQNGYDISADVLGYPESYYTPPTEALKEIEVIRGAASLQYGTQFGGLVNFKMKSADETKPLAVVTRQTVGSYGLFTSFNSVSGTTGKFSYYTFYNFKRGNGYRPNSDFKSHNAFVNLNYQFSEKTKLSADISYLHYLAQQAGGLTDGQFEVDPLFSNRTRNWFEVDWLLYNVKLTHKLSLKTDLSVSFFALNASRNALGFRGIPGSPNDNPITEPDWLSDQNDGFNYSRDLIKGKFNNWGLEARFLTRYKIGEKDAVFLIGSKFYTADNTSMQGPGSKLSDADFNFAFEDTEPSPYPNQSNFKFPNTNLAVFGENVFYLSNTLSITPGFRFEYIKTESSGVYYDLATDTQLTDDRSLPRSFVLLGLGLSNEFDAGFELYANVSQNYRSVTFSDIRTVNPSFTIDPNISDENGFTGDLGLRGKYKKMISYDISVFSMYYKDRIGRIVDDRANPIRTNVGDAIIVGLETFVDWNMSRIVFGDQQNLTLRTFLNLALTNSKYTNSVTGESGIEGNKVEFIPFYNLKTGLSFGYKKLLLSTQFTYLSDQFTDAENSRIPDETDKNYGITGEIPTYEVLDFALSYSYKFVKVESGINNALDKNYFTRRATGYPGPGIIPSDGRNYYVTLQFKF